MSKAQAIPRKSGFQPKHGMSHTKIHYVWTAMRMRCESPTNKDYANYGGRGIRVCERWHDFSAFLTDMGMPPPKGQLDRINQNGNYEPANCRWVTSKVNNRNRRDNNLLTFNGVTRCVKEWSEVLGIPYTTLDYRRRHGYPVEQILRAGYHEKRRPKFELTMPPRSTRCRASREAANVQA